jgi:RimJ/RimL family protein N-acetyltransferase
MLLTLDTDRLRLRWLTDADVPALLEVFGHPEVCRYWSRPPLRDIAEAATLLKEIQHGFVNRTLSQWGIATRTTDQLLGTCTLTSFSLEHRRAEIGFALGRAHWGHGYASEALAALLTHAFESLDLHRLEADVDPRNLRSIRVLEQSGFQREGLQRQRYLLNGEAQDALLYGLLQADYLARGRPRPLLG